MSTVENGLPKLTFQSNLKSKREEALKKRQEQVEKDKLLKQKQLENQLSTLLDDDDGDDNDISLNGNNYNTMKENIEKIKLQEQLMNVNPDEFFKQGGLLRNQDQNKNVDKMNIDKKSSSSSSSSSRTSTANRDNRDDYKRNGNSNRDDNKRSSYSSSRDDSKRHIGNDYSNMLSNSNNNFNSKENNRDNNNRLPYDDKRSSSEVNEFGKRESEMMLEIKDIQNEYLRGGIKTQPGQKKMKKSERNRFIFDWDSYDDTSSEYNTLYSNKTQIKPQFGRGHIAGFDEPSNIDKDKKTITKKDESSSLTNHHWSKKSLNEMNERDWRIFKEDFNITTKGNQIPNPMRNWKEGSLPKQVNDAIARLGYERPSPIQMQSIPISLMGRDILGIAETGSGKTAAFVIPMLIYISKLPRLTRETEAEGPYALVMAPTRELAQQIDKETKSLAYFYGFRSVALVGGLPIEDQANQLSKGCEIVIATPGRLNDCLDKQYLVLNQCNYVVLDEADMMIALGFEKQVESVLECLPSSFLKSENEDLARKQESDRNRVYRTTILFSATMPPAIEQISRKYLRRPCHIIIGEAGKAVDRIKQNVLFVRSENDKKEQLSLLLTQGPPPPIIIFVNKKIHCEIVAGVVEESHLNCTVLHSGKSQEQRESALDGFKKRRYNVLIATDVAARGIHVEGVTHVINFDMPNNIEDYTHRIGRTGRAGMEGLASSLMMEKDVEIMFDLKNMLTQTHNTVPPELSRHPASQHSTSGDKLNKRSETVIYK